MHPIHLEMFENIAAFSQGTEAGNGTAGPLHVPHQRVPLQCPSLPDYLPILASPIHSIFALYSLCFRAAGRSLSVVGSLREQIKEATERIITLQAENHSLQAQLSGAEALRAAQVSQSLAAGRDSMRNEVAAAFKEGLNVAKGLIADARSMK